MSILVVLSPKVGSSFKNVPERSMVGISLRGGFSFSSCCCCRLECACFWFFDVILLVGVSLTTCCDKEHLLSVTDVSKFNIINKTENNRIRMIKDQIFIYLWDDFGGA